MWWVSLVFFYVNHLTSGLNWFVISGSNGNTDFAESSMRSSVSMFRARQTLFLHASVPRKKQCNPLLGEQMQRPVPRMTAAKPLVDFPCVQKAS